jgi:hypothetical protein
MPLTTDYFPEIKDLNNITRYHNDFSQVNLIKTGFIRSLEDYLTEYVCLRLTQNFQLIKTEANPTCKIDFQDVALRKSDIKMSLGNKFNVLKSQDMENFQIKVFTKMAEDALTVK